MAKRKLETESSDIEYLTRFFDRHTSKFVDLVSLEQESSPSSLVPALQEFIDAQRAYVAGLDLYDKLTMRCYSFWGDTLVNAFLTDTLTPELIQNILDDWVHEVATVAGSSETKTWLLQCPLLAQILKRENIPLEQALTHAELLDAKYETLETLGDQLFKLYTVYVQDFHRDLMRILSGAPKCPVPLVLYRGLQQCYDPKVSLRSKTYISTSYDVASASRFLKRYETRLGEIDPDCTLLHITLAADTPCLCMLNSKVHDEKEILLGPNTMFQDSKVTSLPARIASIRPTIPYSVFKFVSVV